MASGAQSSDEGEIVEATPLPRSEKNGGVDRNGRIRGRPSRSPDHGHSSRNARDGGALRRSRSPRGVKRARDEGGRDRDFDRRDRDRDRRDYPRHLHNSYEVDSRRARDRDWDREQDNRPSSHGAYMDLDRPQSRNGSSLTYNQDHARTRPHPDDYRSNRDSFHDRKNDRYAETRRRDRSPMSPRDRDRGRSYRERDHDRHGRDGRADQDKYSSHYDRTSHREHEHTSKQPITQDTHESGKNKDQANQSGVAADGAKSNGSDVNKVPDMGIDYDNEPTAEEKEEAEIARRRARRQAIMDKYRATGMPILQNTGSTPASTEVNTPRSASESLSVNSPMADASSPAAFQISSDQDLINTHAQPTADDDEDGPSAADYDPMADMQEDERRAEMMRRGQGGPDVSAQPNDSAMPSVEEEATGKPRDESDDEFDMFATHFDDSKFVAALTKTSNSKTGGGGILEGDDKDGYYKIRPGELLDGRYQVSTTLGRGMFSGVARAVDTQTNKVVAIKIMRNNAALKKGGYTEIAILQKLNNADPHNKKHIVKFERSFEYKGHLCMAFENLSLNLREVLKKFGNNVGINLRATRVYAYHIFIALNHMRKCSIIHADLKPDNILVNEARSLLKICDLGTAIDRSDAANAGNEVTPYLASRFYRAPEIILGIPYDYAIDMWSIGCTLYELYAGKILFEGGTNNQMLKSMMEIRGKISPKLYRRGQLSGVHFDEQGNFISVSFDKLLGKPVIRTLPVVKPKRDLRARVLAASKGMAEQETKDVNLFIDLLERCLALNPDKRITPSDALQHPFFTPVLTRVNG